MITALEAREITKSAWRAEFERLYQPRIIEKSENGERRLELKEVLDPLLKEIITDELNFRITEKEKKTVVSW